MSIIDTYYQKIKSLIDDYNNILKLDNEYMAEYLNKCGKDLNVKNPETINEINELKNKNTQNMTNSQFVNDEIYCSKTIADSISKLFYKPLAKLLHPDKKQKLTYVESLFKDEKIPVVAATDYMKIYADQIREFIPNKYIVLGTDGFGRSDTREILRDFFEVNKYYIVLSTINLLVNEGILKKINLSKAIALYNINVNKPNPNSI